MIIPPQKNVKLTLKIPNLALERNWDERGPLWHPSLIQNCKNVRGCTVQKDVFLCFVVYKKAFDRVQYEKIIEILWTTDVDIRCIQNLKDFKVKTQYIEICRKVRQGCILSLFRGYF